jgi:hypothetical protein
MVFRLERDVPVVGRLREVAAEFLDRLSESWRMVAAGGVGLLALGFLATVVGGAYGHRTPAAPAPATALPSPPPPMPEPTSPVPAPAPAATADQLAAAPARPVPMRTHPARAGAKKSPQTAPRNRRHR